MFFVLENILCYLNYRYRPRDGIGLETPMSYYQQFVQAV